MNVKSTMFDAKAMLSKISLQIKKIEVKNEVNFSINNAKPESKSNQNIVCEER